ncbi:hypothetical protein [Sulfuricurvum sp.]|uniref:hypothetical protein n=1 Tax=Sulfuricurvum sp. TaxID=2025608 RepID=UPI003569E450
MKIIVGDTYDEMLKRRYFVMIILPFLWVFGLGVSDYAFDDNSVLPFLLFLLTMGLFWLFIFFILITLVQRKILVAMFLSTVDIMLFFAAHMYTSLNMPYHLREANFYIHQNSYEQQAKIHPSQARDNGKKLVEFPLPNNYGAGMISSIVYDESDILAMPYQYRTLNETWDKNNTVVGRTHLDVEHLQGHFYLVVYDNSNYTATQSNLKGNTNGTNSY